MTIIFIHLFLIIIHIIIRLFWMQTSIRKPSPPSLLEIQPNGNDQCTTAYSMVPFTLNFIIDSSHEESCLLKIVLLWDP